MTQPRELREIRTALLRAVLFLVLCGLGAVGLVLLTETCERGETGSRSPTLPREIS